MGTFALAIVIARIIYTYIWTSPGSLIGTARPVHGIGGGRSTHAVL